MSNLVIVESPAKAKRSRSIFGKGFKVLASYGHVRDLIPKEGAVDTENDFAMKYTLVERNQKHVQAITKEMKKQIRCISRPIQIARVRRYPGI